MAFKKTIFAVLALALIIAGLFYWEARGEYRYKGDMALATEYPAPGEKAAVAEITGLLQEIADKEYGSKDRTLRGAHIKQHGLVKAEFTVSADLDPKYRVGLFKRPRTYQAWIRYSNLTGDDPVKYPDSKKNARGMAIKLMGVEGEKILPAHADAQTHDFVFMSTPFFVTKDVEGFGDLMTALMGGKAKSLRHLITHPRLALLIRKTNAATPDLFGVHWYSATPYMFGEGRAVKYIVRPRIEPDATMPGEGASPDFLRHRMAETLSRGNVELDFFIQVQRDAKAMPIEDPRVVWDETRSPPVRVATLRIFKQEFDTEDQHLYGDRLSFSPWHALPEHRPLGGINRGRKAIYDTMSDFRHMRNEEPAGEPEGWDDFQVQKLTAAEPF